MPEISFYINDQERKDLFDFLKFNNAEIIPDLMYSSPKFSFILNSTEFIETIYNRAVGFFIISKSFEKQGLLMEENRFIEKPTFSISQRYGGPYINIELYRGYSEDAEVKYKRTDLHYYPKYINLENYFEELKASEDLKEYYNKIIKFLKSKCKNIQIGKQKYWVSIEVIKELNYRPVK